MIKLISVDELQEGMFIHKLEVWWLKDRRIRNLMLITDRRQIAMIRSEGIRQVWIDLDKSVPIPHSQPVRAPVAESAFFRELDQAQQIFAQGKPRVLAMFNEARMGQRLDLSFTLDLVDQIAGSIAREPSALLSVARLKNHDDYTYLHSMAVCGLMISLGKKLGLEADRLRRAGMAGLLHDVGKPATRRFEKGGAVTFRHHETVGAKLVRKRLRALKFDNDTIKAVARLVELHMRFYGYGDAGWSDSAVRCPGPRTGR